MSLFSLILAAAAGAAPLPAIPAPDPSHMSLKEIRAHNKVVGKDHPYFIRCRRDVEIGSVAKAHTVCRTLRDWSRADDDGNRAARDTVRFMNETAGNIGN
ncbi:hypothetical protein [Novosphingobium sp.]|jgi:hypothetical protein|uniref:hypothetical protein n=1 Tax=Novosphingobium sp. TaxID=1874826 RepID=UPI0035B107E4